MAVLGLERPILNLVVKLSPLSKSCLNLIQGSSPGRGLPKSSYMKILKQIQWMLMLSGAAALYLNFSNPKIAKESLKTLTQPLQVQKLAKEDALKAYGCPTVDESDPRIDERYVKIEGKLYAYNARNVYNVNGITTMYKNGEPKTLRQIRTEEQTACLARHKASDSSDTVAAAPEPASALSVYTPGGMQKVINDAHAAAAKMEERNRALNQLDQ